MYVLSFFAAAAAAAAAAIEGERRKACTPVSLASGFTDDACVGLNDGKKSRAGSVDAA